MRKNYKWAIFFLFASSVVLFNYWIEKLFTNVFLPIVDKVVSVWYNDLLFILLSILISYYIYKNRRRKPNWLNYAYVIFIYSCFCYYRLESRNWDYTSFYFYSKFAYLDLIHIVFLLSFLNLIELSKTKNKESGKPFYLDLPLSKEGEDLLNYKFYAKSIVSKILITDSPKAFAIGINGKWGIGKTSFINLIRDEVEDTDTIQLTFNPWNSINSNAIIHDFFEVLQQETNKYYSRLSSQLYSYSKRLVESNDSNLNSYAHNIVSLLTGIDTIESQRVEIEESIKEINKKILIYIDDLDRLNKEEVLEVFKLIRNTANFRNTFFIVAYDKAYIEKLLFYNNGIKRGDFIDKIFQLEVSLPAFNKKILLARLEKNMKELFDDKYSSEIECAIFGIPPNIVPISGDYLDSLRDVFRLSNALSLNLTTLMGEVDLRDFLQLEMLRIKHADFYNFLFYNRKAFISPLPYGDPRGNIYIYQGKSYDELKVIIARVADDFQYSDRSILQFHDLLKNLFNDKVNSRYNKTKHLSVIYPSRFNRYFAYCLLEGDLSDIEFGNCRNSNIEVFKNGISIWIDQGFEKDIRRKFQYIDDFDSRDDFENVIEAIFYLANQPSKLVEKKDSVETPVWFSLSNIYEKLINKTKINQLYNISEEESDNEYKDFIYRLFISQESKHFFEASFINYYLNSSLYSEVYFPLSRPELREILLRYLSEYCSNNERVSQHFWHFYTQCSLKDRNSLNKNGLVFENKSPSDILFDKATEIVKEFVLKVDLKGFLDHTIKSTTDGNGNKYHKIDNSFFDIFETIENFESCILETGSKNVYYVQEFIDFLNEAKRKGFDMSIKYDFKYFER